MVKGGVTREGEAAREGEAPAEPGGPTEPGGAAVVDLSARIEAAAQRLAAALTAVGRPGQTGMLVINPCSFIRRIGIELPVSPGAPTIERPVYAAEEHVGGLQAVVDVPAMGFVHLASGAPLAPTFRVFSLFL